MRKDYPGEEVIWRDDHHQVFEMTIEGFSKDNLIEWTRGKVDELLRQKPHFLFDVDIYRLVHGMNYPSKSKNYPSLFFRCFWIDTTIEMDPEEISNYKGLPRNQYKWMSGLDLGWIEFRKLGDKIVQVVGFSIDWYSEVFNQILVAVKEELEKIAHGHQMGIDTCEMVPDQKDTIDYETHNNIVSSPSKSKAPSIPPSKPGRRPDLAYDNAFDKIVNKNIDQKKAYEEFLQETSQKETGIKKSDKNLRDAFKKAMDRRSRKRTIEDSW